MCVVGTYVMWFIIHKHNMGGYTCQAEIGCCPKKTMKRMSLKFCVFFLNGLFVLFNSLNPFGCKWSYTEIELPVHL